MKLDITLNKFNEPFGFEEDIIPVFFKKKMVNVFKADGPFLDIGVPEDYKLANKEIKKWV